MQPDFIMKLMPIRPALTLLSLMLAVDLLQAAPDGEAVAAGNSAKISARRQKVRVHDPEFAQQLLQQGAELIADYGSFQLFRVDEALAGTTFSDPRAENADHQNVIGLNARHLDTTTTEVKALRKSVLPSSGKRLHLVQFAGPIKPQWRDALE